MNIGIIGGGSIGLLLSAYLAPRHHVTLYVRRRTQKKRINEEGLFLLEERSFHPNALLITDLKQEDCIFVCVKQHHVQGVLPFMLNLPPDIPFIFLQNGMGHIHKLERIKQPIYLGVVDHGARRIKDHIVKHTGKGSIYLARYQGEQKAFTHFVNRIHHNTFPFYVEEDWKKMLHQKLIINAVINPLTALFQVKNIEIIHNPYIRSLAKKICKEASDILHLDPDQEWCRIQTIATQTGENQSSMFVDLKRKQPTELEAILGYLLKEKKHKMPYTTFIYESIKALEYKIGV